MQEIVIIGPESTGKSTLCAQLAAHFNTTWCPEFAREYLTREGKNYSYQDLLTIAKGQLNLQEKLRSSATGPYYFIDTDQYVMKVWCEVAFEDCHTWILQQVAQHKPHLYLLCDTDLPWTPDELREYPDPLFRRRLFLMYKDIVINSGVPWGLIRGTEAVRLQTALQLIEQTFSSRQ